MADSSQYSNTSNHGGAGQGDDDGNEEKPLSVKGLPEHLKPEVRKEQNRASARRCRERRREEYRELYERYLAQSAEVAALEERVDALVKVLENAGYSVPVDCASCVVESVHAAQQAVHGSASSMSATATDPDNEQLFDEIISVLDKSESRE